MFSRSFFFFFFLLSLIVSMCGLLCVHGQSYPYESVRDTPYTITYDGRGFLLNNSTRIFLQSGSIHYPRATPDMWPNIINQTKAAGVNMIQTYVFWNYHELVEGQYDWTTENRNLLQFLQNIKDAGLFVHLRIGPYACAEWTLGGLPVWLKLKEGVTFRTNNEIWLIAMEQFTHVVLQLVEPYLARHGGPIMLAQIENEYGNVEQAYGLQGQLYVQKIAAFALATNISLPWVMCQQSDAPDSVINTCNGFYCHDWLQQHFVTHPNQPGMWTENWDGWFTHWSEATPHRPVQDDAYAVARFVAHGGTFHNYYMFFGGTSFGRWVGGPMIITSYDYDVPINEYGLPSEPKYTHTKNLHITLDSFKDILLHTPQVPPIQLISTPTCPSLELIQWGNNATAGSVLFLTNFDNNTDCTFDYVVAGIGSYTYDIPSWSVSIIDAYTYKEVFNTAKLDPRTGTSELLEPDMPDMSEPEPEREPSIFAPALIDISWADEPIGEWPGSVPVVSSVPLEQINVTQDTVDYLWYLATVPLPADSVSSSSQQQQQQQQQQQVHIAVDSLAADFFQLCLNGVCVYSGTEITTPTVFSFNLSQLLLSRDAAPQSQGPVTTTTSLSVQLLSQTLGLKNYGTFLETYTRGLSPASNLQVSFSTQDQDPTHAAPAGLAPTSWTHVVGLFGLYVGYDQKNDCGLWQPDWFTHLHRPFTWYRLNIKVDLSDPHAVFAVDMQGMQKGLVYVNGILLGRYWLVASAITPDCDSCDYRGEYHPNKCLTNCGQPTQRYYHIPRVWLTQGNNVVSIFEELGGDVTQVKIVTRN